MPTKRTIDRLARHPARPVKTTEHRAESGRSTKPSVRPVTPAREGIAVGLHNKTGNPRKNCRSDCLSTGRKALNGVYRWRQPVRQEAGRATFRVNSRPCDVRQCSAPIQCPDTVPCTVSGMSSMDKNNETRTTLRRSLFADMAFPSMAPRTRMPWICAARNARSRADYRAYHRYVSLGTDRGT